MFAYNAKSEPKKYDEVKESQQKSAEKYKRKNKIERTKI